MPPERALKPHVPHILACLVHEPVDCAVDLVRNLNRLAPDALVALYVDRRHLDVYADQWPRRRLRAVMIPGTRPVPVLRLPALYEVFFDILRWAAAECRFDALTMVESDQLLISPGLTDTIVSFLGANPRVGLLGSANVHVRQGRDSRYPLARKAHAEIDVWYPFLEEFDGWRSRFVHFTFWPSLVVAGRAVQGLVDCVDSTPSLHSLLQKTRMSAVNEVLVPTLVRLLGWELAPSPASFGYCRWREPFSLAEVKAAMADPSSYWLHPVARERDDSVRSFVRATLGY